MQFRGAHHLRNGQRSARPKFHHTQSSQPLTTAACLLFLCMWPISVIGMRIILMSYDPTQMSLPDLNFDRSSTTSQSFEQFGLWWRPLVEGLLVSVTTITTSWKTACKWILEARYCTLIHINANGHDISYWFDFEVEDLTGEIRNMCPRHLHSLDHFDYHLPYHNFLKLYSCLDKLRTISKVLFEVDVRWLIGRFRKINVMEKPLYIRCVARLTAPDRWHSGAKC